jgi:L-threonylcarbamoyladenylate synthase
MDIIKVSPENLRASQYGIEKAAETIRRGGVVAAPSDTVYGLFADATNPDAVKRVFRIKHRPETKPLPVMVRDPEMAAQLACIDLRLERILGMIWPGAVTVVLRKKFNLPELITCGKDTIGLRYPDYKILHYLIQLAGKPLTATSANISGEEPTHKVSEIMDQFHRGLLRPDLILDAGDLKFCEPSTVLDLTSEKPKIIRIGPVNPKKLMEILSI